MSIFGSIMSKIFNSAVAAEEGNPGGAPQSAGSAPAAAQPSAPATPAAPAAALISTPPQTVDVDEVLTAMASQKGGGGNWRSSIVDLLRMLDLDSSLSARKELSGELNIHAGAEGSAEENIALHKAVMQKLAENGGNVPASMTGRQT